MGKCRSHTTRRLATYHSYSLIELHLQTGRTHQIRVHMKYIGHPLPGDFLYNPDYRIIKRQPLHPFQLEFAHPVTGENMCITAPVPEDFADAFHRSNGNRIRVKYTAKQARTSQP